MAKLVWDATSKRLYETGVDQVVLFPIGTNSYHSSSDTDYMDGVAWNGVTGITESPDGADANDIYADNIKYLSLISAENWKGTIKAYTWPKQFNKCQGEWEFDNGTVSGVFFGQQTHTKFGLAWRTIVGNDVDGDAYGKKLHIAYGLSAAPSEKDHATVNDSPEATEFSWELNSIPAAFKNKISGESEILKPVAHFVIDSITNPTAYGKLEKALFGVDADSTVEPAIADAAPWLPNPDALVTLLTT